jgi:hypothetical protein
MRRGHFWVGLVIGWVLIGWFFPVRDLAAKMRRS